ncbi:hypothetical protein F5878DRAFT_729232 [Lentinula raphanica]|uniref:Secreted protein n=1 Tax=Lentinula raphanica TaxID=153919 RepID=A0AA38NY41_9AGAR|nr:hypothetical protein F5878DRAFT_729232 [Lentinula raphanica]
MVRFDHYTLTVLLTATSIASVLSVPVSVPNTVTISRIEARIGPQTTVMGDPPSYSAKGRISEVVTLAQAQTQAAEPVGEQPYNANAVRPSKDQIQGMKEFLENSGVKCRIEQHQLSSLFVELENPRNPYAVINLIHLVQQCDNVLPKHERYGVPAILLGIRPLADEALQKKVEYIHENCPTYQLSVIVAALQKDPKNTANIQTLNQLEADCKRQVAMTGLKIV